MDYFYADQGVSNFLRGVGPSGGGAGIITKPEVVTIGYHAGGIFYSGATFNANGDFVVSTLSGNSIDCEYTGDVTISETQSGSVRLETDHGLGYYGKSYIDLSGGQIHIQAGDPGYYVSYLKLEGDSNVSLHSYVNLDINARGGRLDLTALNEIEAKVGSDIVFEATSAVTRMGAVAGPYVKINNSNEYIDIASSALMEFRVNDGFGYLAKQRLTPGYALAYAMSSYYITGWLELGYSSTLKNAYGGLNVGTPRQYDDTKVYAYGSYIKQDGDGEVKVSGESCHLDASSVKVGSVGSLMGFFGTSPIGQQTFAYAAASVTAEEIATKLINLGLVAPAP